MSSSADAALQIERRQRVLAVLKDFVDRRRAGEPVSDSELIDSHRDLMPELAVELRTLSAGDANTLTDVSLTEEADPPSVATRSMFSLPGYEIQGEIKSGGQGVVYRAVQQSTGQKVAIKALQGGPFATTEARTRLLRETRILGGLQHPNVVRVYDSGTLQGTVYYVMEYINGQQLDGFLKTISPTPVQIIELFTRICDGVQAAHLRGVIHRDLKPSNILVDHEGQPRIVDFGLAKLAVGTFADDGVAITEGNRFLGTPKYTSPEQARGKTDAVDVRSDVYSLGVLLFSALSGEMPYSTEGTRDEVLRRIAEAHPSQLRRDGKRLESDLEAIVQRCLRKDPDQRYQNAGELARDLRRYLRDEPIEAKRDSLIYVLYKRAARYRWQAGVAAALLVLTIGQAAFANYMWGAVQNERDAAREATGLLLDMIGSLDPDEQVAGAWTPLHDQLQESVDHAAERLDGLDNPETAARLRAAIGHLYVALGKGEQALPILATAVGEFSTLEGPGDPQTLTVRHDFGYALKQVGRYDDAQREYEDVLAVRRAVLGPDHAAVASTLNNLGQLAFARKDYATAQRYHSEALQLRDQLMEPDRERATSRANLGSVIRAAVRKDRVEPDAEFDRGAALERASELLEEALKLRRGTFGDPHLHVANSLNKLGLVEREQALFAEEQGRDDDAARHMQQADDLLVEALEMKTRVLPGEHRDLAVGRVNLAMTRNALGIHDQAAALAADALARFVMRDERGGATASLAELEIACAALGSRQPVVGLLERAEIQSAGSELAGWARTALQDLSEQLGD